MLAALAAAPAFAATVTVSNPTVNEADGTASFDVTVVLDLGDPVPFPVNYATGDSTPLSAVAGSDYTATSGTLEFLADGTLSVGVSVSNDGADEAGETFELTADLATPGTATIVDNDTALTVTTAPAGTLEENVGTVNYIVTATNAPNTSVTVDYTVSHGTTAAADFTGATTGTLTFGPGDPTHAFALTINDDALDEATEGFSVTFTDTTPPGENVTVPATQNHTITDNDAAPTLGIDDVTVTEGNGPGTTAAVFTVTLSPVSGQTVTVDVDTQNGSAVAPGDFAANSQTLTFAPGVTTQTFTVNVVGDTLDEADSETALAVLTNATNATIGDPNGTLTITDDDPLPTVAIGGDVTVTETEATVNANFSVNLTPASGRTVTVNYTTANGTATAGSDYTTTSGTLTFAPGETSKTITVPVLGDPTDEDDEAFFVNLSSEVAATLGDAQAIGTINDNDAPPGLSIGNQTLGEAGGSMSFTASLSAASGKTVTVNYATGGGTATAGADYTAASGLLTYAPGEVNKTIVVPILDDLLDEPNETFNVNLTTPTNATGNPSALGTINDDDATPDLTIASRTVSEGNTGTQAVLFTVSLTAVSGQDVTFNFATGTGTASDTAPNQDYVATSGSRTITAGQTSATFTVTVNGDGFDENNESVPVPLSAVVNANGPATQASLNIIDDDTTHFTVSAGAQTELDNGQTNTASFTITRDRDADHPVAVNWSTEPDTGGTNPAVEGGDYVGVLPTTANFTIGSGLTQNVTVTINGDEVDENTETFRVALTQVGEPTVGGPGLGTITDDDQTLFSIGPGAQTELDAGQTNEMTFTVTRNRPSDHTVTVNFATAPGGSANVADAIVDYAQRLSTALPFTNTDALTKPVTVTVNGDNLDETAETFLVNLTATGDTGLLGGPGIGTITDDDVTNFTVNSVNLTEPDAGTSPLTFTITRDRQSDHPVSVSYATGNSAPLSAVAGTDYTAASGGFTFPDDATTADPTRTFPVAIIGDTVDEGDETFRVNLTAGPDTTAGPAGVGTIVDNDTASLSIADVTVNENAGTATFAVSIDRETDHAISVDWATSNAVPPTALAGADYTAANGTATFPAGSSANQTFTVPITNDALDEDNGNGLAGGTIADETFDVTLSNATSGAVLGDPAAVATILDDDNVPTISINPVTVTEGTNITVGAPPTPAVFNVILSAPSGLPVSATVNTANGPVNGGAVAVETTNSFSDYAALVNAPVTIAPGQPGTTVTVNVNPDNLDEGVGNETFTATLSAPVNAAPATMLATGTITDDDNAPTISVSDATVLEGNAGPAPATFTVTLSNPSSVNVTATCTTANGTATAPADYVALIGTNCFSVPALATSTTFLIDAQGDLLDEPDLDTASVTLANPLNGTLLDAVGVLNIQDDDALPIVNFSAVSPETVLEGNTGVVPRNIAIQLNVPSGRTVTVNWQTGEFPEFAPNATPGVDYVAVGNPLPVAVTFAPGETAKNLPVNIIGDTNADEGGSSSVGIEMTIPGNGNVTLPGGPPNLRQQLIILEDDIANIPPFANPDAVTVTRNTAATFNVRANDVDANADPLFVPDNGAPAHGTAFCQSSGSCQYTPSPGYIGPDSFIYTLSDGRATTVGTVNITVVNAKPVANTDVLTVGQGAPGSVNVVANDTDPDGGVLSVVGSTNGTQGVVACAGTICTYTPTSPAFVGTDVFTYALSDGSDTVTGSVNVTVAKGQPLTATIQRLTAISPIGRRNKYTITITNPNGGSVFLTSIFACVPKGFTHVAGSTIGAIPKNPRRVGTCAGGRPKLVWSGRVRVRPGKTVKLAFQVNVGGAPGRVLASAGGTAASGFAVKPSPLNAAIAVRRPAR